MSIALHGPTVGFFAVVSQPGGKEAMVEQMFKQMLPVFAAAQNPLVEQIARAHSEELFEEVKFADTDDEASQCLIQVLRQHWPKGECCTPSLWPSLECEAVCRRFWGNPQNPDIEVGMAIHAHVHSPGCDFELGPVTCSSEKGILHITTPDGGKVVAARFVEGANRRPFWGEKRDCWVVTPEGKEAIQKLGNKCSRCGEPFLPK